jgi:glycerate kinase
LRVLIAPDSFKGSMSSLEAGDRMAAGLRASFSSVEVEQALLADGGEGTVDALIRACGGEKVFRRVTGPLGEPVEAAYGLLPDGRVVLEVAAASGLPLVPKGERDPWRTTSRGTGELLRDALKHSPSEIVVGLGGSATVDGGIGLLQALGVRILDRDGREVPPGGQALGMVERIDPAGIDPRILQTRIVVAGDVDNPHTGPEGAVPVFAPQKGADPQMLPRLKAGMEHYARRLDAVGKAVSLRPGSGAAGGLGAALVALCGAELVPGFSLIAEVMGLEEKIAASDLVLTGEGRIDGQSLHGKGPVGLARMAKRQGVPVVAFTGAVGEDVKTLEAEGFAAVLPIVDGPIPPEEAMQRGGELLEQSVIRFFRGAAAISHLWFADGR